MARHAALTASGERHVSMLRPLQWLRAGWRDLWTNPVPGLVHGVGFVIFGWMLLLIAHDRFWLLAGAYSGFLLVGPVAVTGLYAVSRGLHRGQRLNLRAALSVWTSLDARLVKFGLLLGFAGTGWVLTSAGFITLFAPHSVDKPIDFLRYVILAEEPWVFGLWLLLGGMLAAPMFASSVIAIPMLMDRPVSLRQALAVSWAVCASHPEAMGVWALAMWVLAGVGMLTGLLGLIVIAPWLAHASWHVYMDMVPANMVTPLEAN